MEYAAHVGHHIEGAPAPPQNPLLMMISAQPPPPDPAAHFILTGCESVRLGAGFAPAARAQSVDTKDALDGEMMKDGSQTVLMGPELKPMVRRTDPVLCGGKVLEGIETILVGG